MFCPHDAAQSLGGEILFADPSVVLTGVSIDSRTLKPGDFFIPLKGTREDGHIYLEKAFRQGAGGAFAARSVWETEKSRFRTRDVPFRNVILVDDTEQALTRLASVCRSAAGIPCVGITGSVGKTSTKTMLHYLLSRAAGSSAVLSNPGNFNNHLGLPITLLHLNQDHRYCAAELGANHRGDIRYLCGIYKPNAGILTRIAPAHLEGFGSLEAIYETKLELLQSLPEGSPAVISAGDDMLDNKLNELGLKGVIRVGPDAQADYRLENIRCEEGRVSFTLNGLAFAFPGLAPFFAWNAAYALAMAERLGIDLGRLAGFWEDFTLPEGRFTLKELGEGIQVVYDGYNANPESFKVSLKSFADFARGRRKIVVFADMLELGVESERYHRELGEYMAGMGFDAVFAYGRMSSYAISVLTEKALAGSGHHFKGPQELLTELKKFLLPRDRIFFKASRGMKIETVMNDLQKNLPFFVSDT